MNNLNREIRRGEIVILNPDDVLPEFKHDTRFLCKSGFGLQSITIGTGIFGKWLIDGEECKMSGENISKPLTLEFQAKYGNGIDPRTEEQQAAWDAAYGVKE